MPVDYKKIQWRRTEKGLVPYLEGREVAWAPQPGAQQAFLECSIFEVLLEGNRGGGKTDVLLMDFLQHVGKGFGAEWRGILFRQTYNQLEDVVAKTRKWFNLIFPSATFRSDKMVWTFPGQETLRLSYMEKPEDYWNYHGHAYPWIGFEELTTWPDPKCYLIMMACSRSTRLGMPRRYRATTNPYGTGHNWVKARFGLPVPPGRLIGPILEEGSMDRVAIHSSLAENLVLLEAEPHYLEKVLTGASNPAMAAAWREGSWDVVAGGMFDDIWRPAIHVVPDIPFRQIPAGWRCDRSYDHGQSKPFSVGWHAESNGEPIEVGGRLLGTVRGDVFRIAEWYGWNGQPNEGLRMLSTEIADGIVQREDTWGIRGRVRMGPADSSIFDDYEPGKSVAGEMRKRGVQWDPANKKPGSRKQGWEQMRKMLKGAIPGREGAREAPGYFICSGCTQFLRTVPVLSRSERDPDDVNTDSEDHVADEARYRLMERRRGVANRSW